MSSALCGMNPKQDRAGFCRGNRGNRGWINWDGPGNPAPANRLAHDPAGIRTSKRERLSRKRRFIQPLTDLPRDRMAAPPKREHRPIQYPNVQAGEPVPKTAVYPAVDGFAAGQNAAPPKRKPHPAQYPNVQAGEPVPKTAVHPAVGGFAAEQNGRAAKKGASSGAVPERSRGRTSAENGGLSRR